VAIQRANGEARRRELANFLRKKREGLAAPRRAAASQQRRLTPGLRREEVAELAGVGMTWYTWLEQARNIRPSERTLRRIARALQLNKTETSYLLDLALDRAPRPRSTGPVPREVLTVVDAMSMPAFVVDRSCDRLFYNRAANALWDFDYAADVNYLRSLFTPEERAFVVNWSEYARRMVQIFRRRSAGVLGDPAITQLIAELTGQSREFSQWWSDQHIPDLGTCELVCDHPFVGRLDLEYGCFGVLEYPDLVTIALASERDDARRRLAELVRQVEQGEHDDSRNLWTALASRQDHHSQYQ
jgi:transcriptional regulator with XRE-family HTH domain